MADIKGDSLGYYFVHVKRLMKLNVTFYNLPSVLLLLMGALTKIFFREIFMLFHLADKKCMVCQ